ncbi:hypothetical protein ACHAXA_002266 [Cyclostephanos tholiformis]|uniref:Ubiquitin-like protease family profile domain-containing protein n=1 Tax=Cyclostephanos tholiformis TaxID=382380 RepID=A0ABD3RV01_9STRA
MGNFLVEFFCGPCLDNSAVEDPRQDGPFRERKQFPQRQSRSQQRLDVVGGSSSELRKCTSIPESDDRGRITDDDNGNNSVKTTSNRDLERQRSRSSHRHSRSDDASVMTASLVETYRGYSTDDREEYLDQQSVIRRSLKDVARSKRMNRGEGRPSQRQIGMVNVPEQSQPSTVTNQTSETSALESWIKKTACAGDPDGVVDYDNVTTISKASKNPYGVLGLDDGASPREIHRTYKHKMKETLRSGGSDQAFADVDNAYRRIKADIARRESRKERRRMSQQANGVGIKKASRRKSQSGSSHSSDDSSDSAKSRIGKRLKDHRELVKGLFNSDNSASHKTNFPSSGSVSGRGQVTTLKKSIKSQSKALSEMNLVAVEAGAVNVNEQNQSIQNNCFYLSLAASYLSGAGAFDEDPTLPYYLKTKNDSAPADKIDTVRLENKQKQNTMSLALHLKRAIESAVLLVHPEWAKTGMVGEEVQAFSDFLVYALDSNSVLGHWAIAVFDEASGFVDIYRGRHYGKIYPPTKCRPDPRRVGKNDTAAVKWRYKECNEGAKRGNTLTLRYVDSHYQPLLPELTKMKDEGGRDVDCRQARPTLEDILTTLDKWNVLHVVTDGRA